MRAILLNMRAVAAHVSMNCRFLSLRGETQEGKRSTMQSAQKVCLNELSQWITQDSRRRMVAQEPERVEEGKKGGKQVKRGGGTPKTCCQGGGFSKRAAAPFPSPTSEPSPPVWGDLSQVAVQSSLSYKCEGVHPLRDRTPVRVQYIQVNYQKLRGFKVKKGNVRVGSQGINPWNPTLPLNLHVPQARSKRRRDKLQCQ